MLNSPASFVTIAIIDGQRYQIIKLDSTYRNTSMLTILFHLRWNLKKQLEFGNSSKLNKK